MKNDIWNKQLSMKHRGGYPLRPPEEVIKIIYDLIIPLLNVDGYHHEIVLLGVTPEIVALPWPQSVSLRAFDQSEEMIASVWHPNPGILSSVEQSLWQSMPLNDASVDFILGDGCTTQLSDDLAYIDLFAELRRVLKPNGVVIMRCFVRPHLKETLDEVTRDAFAGEISHFGSLKWRIAMALANQSGDSRIRVDQIYSAFNNYFPDRNHLAKIAGWSLEMVDTIDTYRGSSIFYTFPTLTQLENLVKPHFKISEIHYGKYELSDRCPILLLRGA